MCLGSQICETVLTFCGIGLTVASVAAASGPVIRDAFSYASLRAFSVPLYPRPLSLSLSLSFIFYSFRLHVVNFRRYNDQVVTLPMEFDVS